MLVCPSVCLFVSNKRQIGWTDRAQILCGASTPGKIYECKNYKRMSTKFFDFRKILKIHKKMIKTTKKFIFVLSKRKCWKIDRWTNKSWNRRWSTFRIHYCNIKAVQFLLRCSNMFLSSLKYTKTWKFKLKRTNN